MALTEYLTSLKTFRECMHGVNMVALPQLWWQLSFTAGLGLIFLPCPWKQVKVTCDTWLRTWWCTWGDSGSKDYTAHIWNQYGDPSSILRGHIACTRIWLVFTIFFQSPITWLSHLQTWLTSLRKPSMLHTWWVQLNTWRNCHAYKNYVYFSSFCAL